MKNKHLGSNFEDSLLEDLRSSDEMVFLHIKDALENPSVSGEGDDYDYLIGAISDVAKARGKTEIAESAGISRQYLHKILNGESNPSIQNVMAILEVIGLKFTVEKIGETITDSSSPASALDVAEYINKHLSRDATVMKLQKLTYYSQVESLVHYKNKLFEEKIEAWAAGPVVKEIYDVHKGLKYPGKVKFGNADNLSLEQKTCIGWAIEKYGKLDGDTLSHLTHIENPWKDARGNLAPEARSNAEITDESIISYYSTLPDYSLLDDEAVG